jgi:hypothetical protein
MTPEEFQYIVEHNRKWTPLLEKCSGCGCWTNPEYCGQVRHRYDCRAVRGWRYHIWRHGLSVLRWKLEHLIFTGYNPWSPRSRYFASQSQPKENWPLAIWRRNACRYIETRLIRWY